jgi:hypothetical protein
MKVSISHDFDVDADTFWNQLFFDDAFNRALYVDALRFPEWKVLENNDRGTEVVRRVRVMPKQEAPAAVQKLLGSSFSYTEEGTFDKNAKRYRFRVVPATMADKVRTEGEMRVESLGPKKCRRSVDVNIDVKIFGVGGMIEGFVAKSTQDSYEQAAAFTRKWIAEKGL